MTSLPLRFHFASALTARARFYAAGHAMASRLDCVLIAAKRCRVGAMTALLVALVGLSGGWSLWAAWADEPPQGSPPAGQIIPITHTNVIGTLKGIVSVGASGAAGWTTALKIVPGVGGIEPTLSIDYEGGGYGGLGLGFSLNAGDAISRCRRTFGQDGRHQPVSWTQDSLLCMGNTRLVAVSGMYGAAGTEYRLQTNPNVRIKANGSSTDQQSGFALYTPDGRVTHYGMAPDAAWTHSSMQWANVDGAWVPFSWHIARVIDRKTQNQMQYHYTGSTIVKDGMTSPHDHRLIGIRYGINEAAGQQQATRQVLFEYAPVQSLIGEPKPWEATAFVNQGYVSGMAYSRSQVLTRVEMQVRATKTGDWQFVRQYRLGYEPVPDVLSDSSSPDRLRLATLSECVQTQMGIGDSTPCFRPTRFEWSKGATHQVPMPDFGWSGASFYPLPPASQLKTTPYRRAAMQVVADLDGDGDEDMLVMPEQVNAADSSSSRWELWRTDPDIHEHIQTNIATWGAEGPWTNRAGTVVPSQGAITKSIDGVQTRPPEAVQKGYLRDEKATPGAWAMNYDGTGGTDVLVGEPLSEIGPGLMDPPVGLGWRTGASRRFANQKNNQNQGNSPCNPYIYDWQVYKPCMDDLHQSKADYTGHPGFMRGLKVLRVRSADAGTFSETSLNFPQGRPLLWVAPPLDMNGDGLQDLMFCKADANYAAVAGMPMPMFYGPGADPVNWVSGRMYYQLNVPGQGIDLSQGGYPASSSVGFEDAVPCHAKDSYMVLDLYGDGRQSLLHRAHPHVGQIQLSGISPYVPAGIQQDPFPKHPSNTELSGYWQKQREKVWAEHPTGETTYQAFTYEIGTGMTYRQTGLPYEYFMRWQHSGNIQGRYSTHQAALPTDPDGGFVWKPPFGDTRDGRLTDWGSPDALMVGGGPSEARTGDMNGDGLTDVLMVDLMACHYGRVVGDTVSFPARPCSFQDVTEFGGELIEQTYEKLGVFVYLNRGDGNFELGSATRLWDTDMPSVAHKNVLEKQYSQGLSPADIDTIYKEAWTIATRATRGWRLEFASSLIGDANADGLADLGYIRMDFLATGGWLGDSMAGKYTMVPTWRLGRQSGGLSEVDTPMGLDIAKLVPESAPTGWPGWQQDLMQNNTTWQEASDSPATLNAYAQQEYGLSARLMQLDVNHDGRAETAFYDHVRGRYMLATPYGGDEPQPNLLTAVTDGLGARTELDYAPQSALTWKQHLWTDDDVALPYPWFSRPSTAPAVARMRTDTGLDEGNQPLYNVTEYAYGKTVADVRNGVNLGIDYHVVMRSTATPSGPSNSLRVDHYDTALNFDPVFKAYPMAGALLSTTARIWGDSDEPARLAHSGQRYSAKAGLKAGTWSRRLDASSVTAYETDGALSVEATDAFFVCLVDAYDPTATCALGQGDSYQPLKHTETVMGYDQNGYGLVRNQIATTAGSTTVTEREFENHDPGDPSGQELYLLGLPTFEWVANKPKEGVNYVLRTSLTEYYADGKIKATTIEPDRAQYRIKESFAYDKWGQLQTRTVSAPGIPDAAMKYEYDAYGAYLTKVTNALGHTQTLRWFEGCAMPEHSTNALGQTVVQDIDEFCRERGTQSFFGAQPLGRKTITHYQEWDPNGNEAYADHESLTTNEVEGGAKTQAIANRLGQVLVNQGTVLGYEVYTQTRYDAEGRPWQVSLPAKVGEQPAAWVETGYDAQSRVNSVQKPDGTAKTTYYWRNTITTTDEHGYSGTAVANALGQVVKVSPPQPPDPDPNQPGQNLSMCYDYGAFSTLVEVKPCTATSAKGPHWMTYDDYGRLIRSEDAQAGIRVTRYDPLGRVDESEDAQGQVTKHRYDVLGRLTERVQAYATPQAKSALWQYDMPVPGMLSKATNAEGTVTKETILDDYNRAVGATTKIHGRSFTTRINYDGWGRVSGQSYPTLSLLAPVQLWHQYNDWDQPIGLHHAGKLLWQPIKADVWGHLTEQLYGPSLTAIAMYAPDTGRLQETQVLRKGWITPDLYVDEIAERFTYGWYETGLIRMRTQKALTPDANDQVDQFYYTPRGELSGWTTLGAQQAVKQQYLHTDGFGNITDSPSGHYTYQNERLTQIEGPLGALEYEYDNGQPHGNGNVTERKHKGGATRLVYNELDRVSEIKDNQSHLKITYDADGNKVHVRDAYSGRETFYLGAYQEERGGVLGSIVIGRYAFGPAHLTRTWAADLSYKDDLAYVLPADHLGSTTLVADASGATKDRRSYGVWGDERDPANWTVFKAGPKDDLKNPNSGFTGAHERRQRGATAPGISGIVDMQARYYDPTAMQFLQPDSIIPDAFSPLSWNRRTYANNSPAAFSDPTGHAPEVDPGLDVGRHVSDAYEGMHSFATEYLRNNAMIAGTLEIAGTAFTGTQAQTMMSLRANKHKLKQDRLLSNKAVEDMTSDEKFLYQSYLRDAANYKMAGMEAPFKDVDEYMLWRVMSKEAQDMGISSMMLDNMANTAEVAASAAGFTSVNPMKGVSNSAIQAGVRAGSKLSFVARVADVWRSLRATTSLNLSEAFKKGKLFIGFEEGKGVLRLHGKQIGKVEVTSGGRLRVELDSKYATVENTQTLLAALPKYGARSGIGRVAFVFADKAEADAFEGVAKSNARAFTPATSFRDHPAQVEVNGITYFGPGGKGLEHHVFIDVDQF